MATIEYATEGHVALITINRPEARNAMDPFVVADDHSAWHQQHFEQPRAMHQIVDPDIGDRLMVITAMGPARGFLKPQDFVELRALANRPEVGLRIARHTGTNQRGELVFSMLATAFVPRRSGNG